jgi:hypothetical protein
MSRIKSLAGSVNERTRLPCGKTCDHHCGIAVIQRILCRYHHRAVGVRERLIPHDERTSAERDGQLRAKPRRDLVAGGTADEQQMMRFQIVVRDLVVRFDRHSDVGPTGADCLLQRIGRLAVDVRLVVRAADDERLFRFGVESQHCEGAAVGLGREVVFIHHDAPGSVLGFNADFGGPFCRRLYGLAHLAVIRLHDHIHWCVHSANHLDANLHRGFKMRAGGG